ncbi:MAG TPA: hypothetical protein VJZ27_06155 [Aggregatilineales bacterium]|nr:hypothetical protein [Aggregatilineales bacterium]
MRFIDGDTGVIAFMWVWAHRPPPLPTATEPGFPSVTCTPQNKLNIGESVGMQQIAPGQRY